MSKQATLQIRIDETLKETAEHLFSSLGLSVSEAVRLFIAQSVNERRLPFTPHLSKSEGETSSFGKLRHYANPHLSGDERAAWIKEQGSRRPRISSFADGSSSCSPVIVDETVLLHYLLDDDTRASAKAYRIVASGTAQAYPETIARTARLLEENYHVPRSLLGTVIELLADDVSLEDGAAVRLAARLYAGNRLSFTDSLTAARNVLTGYAIETFNPALKRLVK
ncbi:type II toxin-antitoxin system RelB/DinJ family antitoxin [uncultured Adlercreutzia sp.]|uniref:type II toxin-antitoxin system RelB/DinJ family antitoxin n=1 Tax=uncultured Adlercreutzia sp. TaxID=875803 RepID=UPI0025E357E2|nr:type II toxin-antitoxin system RelB/DinJ family antitoxin [uncultured Adlercreutzia sp.]MCI9262661.1 type II toxin-antitoxin system RelB/DinJ family antitoxin [Eggerthellaceae bacterium]